MELSGEQKQHIWSATKTPLLCEVTMQQIQHLSESTSKKILQVVSQATTKPLRKA
jgi:hypothetical protein